MILDTSAVSALVDKNPALVELLRDARRLAVTLITLGELAYGLRQSSNRRELERWIHESLLTRVELLLPDLATVEHYADVRNELKKAGTPIPANDIWIAALARQHELPLLSLDLHFDRVSDVTRLCW